MAAGMTPGGATSHLLPPAWTPGAPGKPNSREKGRGKKKIRNKNSGKYFHSGNDSKPFISGAILGDFYLFR